MRFSRDNQFFHIFTRIFSILRFDLIFEIFDNKQKVKFREKISKFWFLFSFLSFAPKFSIFWIFRDTLGYAILQLCHRPPPSLNGSTNESDTSWYPPPSSESEISQTYKLNESSDTETTVRDYELHINSTDTETDH